MFARGPAHGPALLPRRHRARTPSRSSSKASTSPTRTTSPASAPLYGDCPYREPLFWANATTPSAETPAEQVEAVRVLPQPRPPAGAAHQVHSLGLGSTPSPTAPHPPRRRSRITPTSLFTYYKDQVSSAAGTLLVLRRHHAHLRHRPTPMALRHRRLRPGQPELSPDPWLCTPTCAPAAPTSSASPRPAIRGHRRGRRLPPRGMGRPRHPARSPALRRQRAKQQRIANTTYRRYYYFLTATNASATSCTPTTTPTSLPRP